MNTDSPVLPAYELISDVELTLHAELDHKTFTFEQILNLRVDSVLNLARPTGENVDIYAGQVLIGTGEILILDTALAIRIADLRGKPSESAMEK